MPILRNYLAADSKSNPAEKFFFAIQVIDIQWEPIGRNCLGLTSFIEATTSAPK
jgi:hypothetical protein